MRVVHIGPYFIILNSIFHIGIIFVWPADFTLLSYLFVDPLAISLSYIDGEFKVFSGLLLVHLLSDLIACNLLVISLVKLICLNIFSLSQT